MALIPESISAARVKGKPTFWRIMGAYRCDGCGWHSIGVSGLSVVYSDDTPTSEEKHRALTTNVVEWHPEYPRHHAFPNVPDHIASAASEAYECQASERTERPAHLRGR